MTSSSRSYRQVARAALNELHVCRKTLLQLDALFRAIQNTDLSQDVLDNLSGLGIAVACDIANLTDDHLTRLEAELETLNSAPQNAQPENVAREFVEGSL